MNKNFVIAYLVITVVILIGIIMILNFELFSEGWLISLSVILIAIAVGIGLTYFKIKK
jgi:uncharacterized membrane protein YdbT with pleckstrin-like domain